MLLELNFSTCFLELAFDLLSLFLGDTLLNSLGSTVNESLGVAQLQEGRHRYFRREGRQDPLG